MLPSVMFILYRMFFEFVVNLFTDSFLSSVATWSLSPPEDGTGWRHIRVKMNGPNASGQTHYLSLSGLEIYGKMIGLADEDLGEC